jgi:6-phosphogluconolactonase
MTTLTTRRFPSRAALDAALAQRLARAIAAPGPSAIMLSGGTTPLPAYRALAQRPPPHDERLHLLFSDDRYVPADSDASNYHQSRPLLDALALPAAAVVRVRTELALDEAAADYERQLAALLNSGVRIGLGLLGLGADGHTASLFGAADLERAREHLAIAVHRPDGMSAVSVTPDLLATVKEPVFVVAGAGKEAALKALLGQNSELIAWRAVQGCAHVELWVASCTKPRTSADQASRSGAAALVS